MKSGRIAKGHLLNDELDNSGELEGSSKSPRLGFDLNDCLSLVLVQKFSR